MTNRAESDARRFADGYSDRQRGLSPESNTDSEYFRGYCERLMDELRTQQSTHVAAV